MSRTREELEWIESRPKKVQNAIKRYPPEFCYRSKRLKLAHYRLYSYDENRKGEVKTVKVIHLDDSFLPGYMVFGVKLN